MKRRVETRPTRFDLILMSENRTQPASKRRRQMARERGQAAHSPELTAAAGWLVALGLWGALGEGLTAAMVALVRSPLEAGATVTTDPAETVHRIRAAMMMVGGPLGLIFGGFVLGALGAHQAQVRGLWAPSLIAPDASRLWRPSQGGGGASAQFERSAWAVFKTLILVFAAIWGVRSQWGALMSLGGLEPTLAAGEAFEAILGPTRVLAVLMLAIGLIDYGLRFARFEAMLRTTAQEHREDQKMAEGDPVARATRRRLVMSWRDSTPELLAGASLILLGDAGLVVVLGGGPPPRKVSIRTVARGASAASIRKNAPRAKVPSVEGRQLALAISALPQSTTANAPLRDPLLMSQLRTIWPVG